MPRRKVNENGAGGSAGPAAINATTGATNAAKPRARRTKKETAANVAVLEANKHDMVQNLYDTQTAPTPQSMQQMQVPQQPPVMHHHHNHNGMMVPMHPDDGNGPTAGPPPGTASAAAVAAHQMYVQSAVPGPMGGPPPPEYYHHPHAHPHQVIPAGYHGHHHHHHAGAMQGPPGNAQSAQPQGGPQQTPHQFIEPDAPPHSPFVGQPSHMQPPPPPQAPNHVLMRYGRHGVPPNHQGVSTQLEYRLNEMNRRLFVFSNSGIPEKDHAQWWDAFAHEFFDDDAKMSFVLYDDQNPGHHSRYSIGRMLIPRFYRSIFDSGVKEMFYVIRSTIREQFTTPWALFLDCENVLLVSKHEKPFSSEVHTECKLMCEFVYDDSYGYRARQWNMELRHCQEYILRDANMVQDSETQEKLKMNITRSGLTQATLNYLKLCAILEPMQILMSRSKSHNMSPRETLKQTLFQAHAKFQQMQAQQQQQQQQHQQMALNAMIPGGMNAQHVLSQASVDEPVSKKPSRKRTRKAAAGGPAPATGSKKKNNSPPAPNATSYSMNSHMFPVQYQDVMVVGEPSMMGGEYGDEDERTISRVENTQFDPNAMSNQLTNMNQQMPASMALGGPTQVYMNDYELSSIGGWGVGGGNPGAAPNQSTNCGGTPLGVGTPITSCDQQQT